MKKEMFNKIEVKYGDYKNNYSHCVKSEYNAETKNIEIFVLKDEYLNEAALNLEKKLAKIEKLNASPQEKMKEANNYMHYLTKEYGTSDKIIKERLKEIRMNR